MRKIINTLRPFLDSKYIYYLSVIPTISSQRSVDNINFSRKEPFNITRSKDPFFQPKTKLNFRNDKSVCGE